MIYKWKDCSHISIDANTAGKVCSDLEERGELTASKLVDTSRPEEAPLHTAFEWNNDVAGELWREHQARHIINCLVIEQKGQEEQPVRAFFVTHDETRKYESTLRIMSSESKKADLLKTALAELNSFRRKYATLKELDTVFIAIDEVAG